MPSSGSSSSSTTHMREHLELSRQFDTLAADLHTLAAALHDQPRVPPPDARALEAVPFNAIPSRSDCRWPAAEAHVAPSLAVEEALALEERTFQLLTSLGASPHHSGPLTNDMLAAATPPPHKPRREAVRVISYGQSAAGGATAAAGAPSQQPLQFLADTTPIVDADLQPVPGSRLPDENVAHVPSFPEGAAPTSSGGTSFSRELLSKSARQGQWAGATWSASGASRAVAASSPMTAEEVAAADSEPRVPTAASLQKGGRGGCSLPGFVSASGIMQLAK